MLLSIDPLQPEPHLVERAAAELRAGRLVAFPTETVYGLGAHALDPVAVQKIFNCKGRPANNPLIVHVASVEQARALATDWPDSAARLAARFWPGPLSLVLPKREEVPDFVTAGNPTVAIRIPAHPVALAILRAAGIPVAAPSANPANRVSATRAEHVERYFGASVEVIVDGGPTSGGIESTVVDLSVDPPQLLRSGLVTQAMIEETIGLLIERAVRTAADRPSQNEPLRSPGMLPKHYAPLVPMEWAIDDGLPRVHQLIESDLRVGWLVLATNTAGSRAAADLPDNLVVAERLPADPEGFARGLYAALLSLEAAGVDRIIVPALPDDDAWHAIRDRLTRATARCEAD